MTINLVGKDYSLKEISAKVGDIPYRSIVIDFIEKAVSNEKYNQALTNIIGDKDIDEALIDIDYYDLLAALEEIEELE